MSAMTESGQGTDASLIGAYRAGDQRAAAALVARHGPPLGRYLYSSGAGPSDIDDFVQETFFRAFRSLERWRGEASFRNWLYTIAGNLLKDDYRRRKGRIMLSIEDRDLTDRADPAGELDAAEADGRIRAGLSTLPRLQREVFLMRVHEGSEYADIAAALGTTAGAARVHYHHAVRRLKELVQ